MHCLTVGEISELSKAGRQTPLCYLLCYFCIAFVHN